MVEDKTPVKRHIHRVLSGSSACKVCGAGWDEMSLEVAQAVRQSFNYQASSNSLLRTYNDQVRKSDPVYPEPAAYGTPQVGDRSLLSRTRALFTRWDFIGRYLVRKAQKRAAAEELREDTGEDGG